MFKSYRHFKTRQTEQIRSRQTGISLIEIVVALFLMAVGLVAMAQLQMKTMRHNNTAVLRSQAVLLAEDIVERIQAGGLAQSPSSNLTANRLSINSTNTAKCVARKEEYLQASLDASLTQTSLDTLSYYISYDNDDNPAYQPSNTNLQSTQNKLMFCTPNQLANYEFTNWNEKISQLLPNGQGDVTVNGNMASVKIQWQEIPDNHSTGTNIPYHEYTLNVQLN